MGIPMLYEVELKFPLAERQTMEGRLSELGATRHEPVAQRDLYFNHPSRDFAVTDEALRIRSSGGTHYITYKGPLVDSQSKTRREIEVSLGDGSDGPARLAEILKLLGFRDVRTVAKTRTPWQICWEGRALDLAIDEVEELGTFLEIEALADESDREATRDSILRLARRLGLENSERRSYLALLLG